MYVILKILTSFLFKTFTYLPMVVQCEQKKLPRLTEAIATDIERPHTIEHSRISKVKKRNDKFLCLFWLLTNVMETVEGNFKEKNNIMAVHLAV